MTRCRACDRDLVPEPPEGAPDVKGGVGAAPLPETVLRSAGLLSADLRLGAGRFFAAVAGLARSRRLLGLLAVLAILAGLLSRYYSGMQSWWLPWLHPLRVNVAWLADMFIRPIADPLSLLSDRPAIALSMLLGLAQKSHATALWLRALALAVVWALVHALVVVVVYAWLRSRLRREPLGLAALRRSLRLALPPVFGFQLLLVIPGQVLSMSHLGEMLSWYGLRALLALTPFVIVGLETGLGRGIVLGLRAMRARWARVLGAWIAYLAMSVGVGLAFSAVSAAMNLHAPGLLPQWPVFAALMVVWSFLAGWLAFAVCDVFMETALEAGSHAPSTSPRPAPSAGVPG